MNKLIILLSILLSSCAPVNQAASTDSNCTGNSGNSYTCSAGTSCSRSGGYGCSALKDGVACCGTGSTTSNDGTNNCSLGYCWTNPENVCCPQNAQYACNGSCYTTNVCNYTSYRSACHQY